MTLSAGTRLGPYEVLAPLGAGGMGEVYRAKDPRLGREVAVKVLPAAFSQDADRLKRFEQEARSASALNHPNIVTIHEVGSANGASYIAMELVDGPSLREMLASGPMPAKKLLDVTVQIAEALAKAHGAGIVHRDLKPENIIVTKDGYAKLLDFGLAKLFVAPSEQATAAPTIVSQETSPGTVMGTVGYMSPEQASGRPVDFRSDQFSFGSILYEMATGQRAFQKATGAQTLAAIIQDDPEPVAQISPGTPAPLRWIVERCLAKDPDERYASTRDLARDLKSVREHISEVTSTASGSVGVVEPVRRRSLALPLALAGILIAAVGVFAGRRSVPSAQPKFQRLTFQRGTVLDARFGPDGQTVYYAAAWEGKPPRIFSLRPGTPESAELPLPPANLLALSPGGEIAILLEPMPRNFVLPGTLARAPIAGGPPKEILQDVTAADWAPGGTELAVVHRVSGKDRLEFPIGKVLYETGGWLQNPRFSPDGSRIAFIDHEAGGGDSGAVSIVDRAGKKTNLAQGWATVQGLAWAPSGREIFFTAARQGIQREIFAVTPGGKQRLVRTMQGTPALFDIAGSGALVTEDDYRAGILAFLPGQDAPRDLSWFDWQSDRALSPDGTQFLFDESGEGGGASGSVYLRGTDGAAALRLGDGIGVALSPDGAWALTQTTAAPVRFVLVPVRAGQSRPLPPDNFGSTPFGAFLPDGKHIVFEASTPGHGSRLYSKSIDGGSAKAFSGEGLNQSRIFVSPDGRYVAAIGPDLRVDLYPTVEGPAVALAASQVGDVPAGWTADGKGLYVAQNGASCRVDLIDIASGRRTHVRDLIGGDAAGVTAFGPARVTPDGRVMTSGFNRVLSTLYRVRDLR